MATANGAPRRPAPEVTEQTEVSTLFQWCENQQARIVWGEYLNGKKFCRVRLGRQLECEGPDFRAACLEAKRRWERINRSNTVRQGA